MNRNSLTHNIGALHWDGLRRGPALPDGYDWCDSTRRWWDTWRDSPQATLMLDTDWEEMLITARLHNYLWGMHMVVDKVSGGFIDTDCSPGDARSLAGEIRIRLEKMGATIKDRGSLGMKIGDQAPPVVAAAEEITRSAVDYRKQLGG